MQRQNQLNFAHARIRNVKQDFHPAHAKTNRLLTTDDRWAEHAGIFYRVWFRKDADESLAAIMLYSWYQTTTKIIHKTNKIPHSIVMVIAAVEKHLTWTLLTSFFLIPAGEFDDGDILVRHFSWLASEDAGSCHCWGVWVWQLYWRFQQNGDCPVTCI